MLKIILGVFIILHGLVHLLYFGQGMRYFELQPGMLWPDGGWAFSRLLGEGAARWLAGIACVVAAAAFVTGGIGIFAGQTWWRPLVVGTAALSTVIFFLFWDGKIHKLADQGLFAILINLGLILAVQVFRWPVLK